MTFNPSESNVFSFESYNYNTTTQTLSLAYALDDLHFEETFTFHGAQPIPDSHLPALDCCFQLLHILAGVSYYKTAIPQTIQCNSYTLNQHQARFFNTVYQQGLGEFAYRNQLNIDHISFPFEEQQKEKDIAKISLKESIVIPIGGGKDSLVSATLCKDRGLDFSTFVLGDFPVIDTVCDTIGYPKIHVSRKLSDELFALNAAGAYNGHVPISAIIAGVLTVASVLYDFDTALLSNEDSANIGNLQIHGLDINHQYSKSLAFERDFRRYVQREIPTNFSYFSLLRPLSELAIAKKFVQNKQYDDVFTSCNRAFQLRAARSPLRWCSVCPKCCSTFLCLSAFTTPDRLIGIFGANLLDNQSLVPVFAELCGFKGHKPFECVIDTEEALAVFIALSASDSPWRNYAVLQWFQEQNKTEIASIQHFLIPKSLETIPEKYRDILNETI